MISLKNATAHLVKVQTWKQEMKGLNALHWEKYKVDETKQIPESITGEWIIVDHRESLLFKFVLTPTPILHIFTHEYTAEWEKDTIVVKKK